LGKSPASVIVECAGVGYELAISIATFTDLGEPGSEARLHVHTHVREDALLLFGFSEATEKRLFEKLLTISGVGPKLAITVLSGISADRLVGAIRGGDHATLTKIPGIGRKTAERVILELKDKLDDMVAAPAARPAAPSLGAIADDVLSAMLNLGYPRPVAQKAVETAAGQDGAAGDFERMFRAAMTAVR
jgi:Holliday junction DNA helicase RuvA